MIHHSSPWITKQDEEFVLQQLNSRSLADGVMLRCFEEELSKRTGGNQCIVGVSGTAALYMALLSLNLNSFDEVILPTYVCQNVYQAVKMVGAIPILCDVGSHWNMTPETVESCITDQTKAIILVNIFGIEEPVSPFRKFGVTIINDLCQSFDTTLSNNHAFSVSQCNTADLGDLLILSFHATKCLTSGRGGAVVIANPKLRNAFYEVNEKMGKYFSMSDLEASLGYSQLTRYQQFQSCRLSMSREYFRELPEELLTSLNEVKLRWNAFRFPLRHHAMNVEYFLKGLEKKNIIARRGVDSLIHRSLGLEDACFLNAIDCFNQTISIPFYPALGDVERKEIVRACKDTWIEMNKYAY